MNNTSTCESAQPEQLQVLRLDRHSTYRGNRCDINYYEFATNVSLRGLPTLLLEDAIASAIIEVRNKLGKTL